MGGQTGARCGEMSVGGFFNCVLVRMEEGIEGEIRE